MKKAAPQRKGRIPEDRNQVTPSTSPEAPSQAHRSGLLNLLPDFAEPEPSPYKEPAFPQLSRIWCRFCMKQFSLYSYRLWPTPNKREVASGRHSPLLEGAVLRWPVLSHVFPLPYSPSGLSVPSLLLLLNFRPHSQVIFSPGVPGGQVPCPYSSLYFQPIGPVSFSTGSKVFVNSVRELDQRTWEFDLADRATGTIPTPQQIWGPWVICELNPLASPLPETDMVC